MLEVKKRKQSHGKSCLWERKSQVIRGERVEIKDIMKQVLFEPLLATKWHKMRGWLWKVDRGEDRHTERRRRARLGRVQMEANLGDGYRVLVRGGKREEKRIRN